MRDRGFADFMVGAIACLSVVGFYAALKESEYHDELRRHRAALRWALPRKRHRGRSPEDGCRDCGGTGRMPAGAAGCHVCDGTGREPRDPSTASRLALLWDGVA